MLNFFYDNRISFPNFSRLIKECEWKNKEEIKIKLHCSWTTSEQLLLDWAKMGTSIEENKNVVWSGKRKKIVATSGDDYDYHVVVNATNDEVDLSRTLYFRMEPNMREKSMWKWWRDPSPDLFLFYAGHCQNGEGRDKYNNVEWHLSKNYNSLLFHHPEKTKGNVVSTVLSDKYYDPGHILRVDFVKSIEDKMEIEVYGGNKFDWVRYMGALPRGCKDDGIFPYKYTFNVENNSIPGYFTEKIVDGILGECLVFYSGCPDINKWIDERAFVRLDLEKDGYEKCMEIMKRAIRENWWEKRLPFIRKEKEKILNTLQFFPRIEKFFS